MKYIELTQGKKAIVDKEDYELLSQHKWTYSDGYAYRRPKGEKIWMHRLISKVPNGLYTDHINGNKLDNRRKNLRHCTYAQNNKNAAIRKDNKTGYKGVYWEKGMSKYRCVIQNDGKRITLGYFDCKHEAAKTYNEKAKELHGEFARLNDFGGVSSK